MNSATVAALVPAIVGLVTAVAALIRAETAHAKVNTQQKIDLKSASAPPMWTIGKPNDTTPNA